MECPHDGAPLISIALDPKDPHLGRKLAHGNHFVVTERVGAGAYAVVYRAIQYPLGREVALKFLSARRTASWNAVQRFLREARAIAALRNQHTIQLHSIGTADDGSRFIAMELVRGESLETLIDSAGPFRPERAAHIVTQVCESLEEAHQAGLIHRDLKPANIMVEQRPHHPDFVHVLDFGMAKDLADDAQLTEQGTVVGTPRFMSPEQSVSADLTPASDLYSLGVVMYAMLAGRLPWDDVTTVVDIIRAHRVLPPLPLRRFAPKVSAELAAIVEGLLAKDPAHRGVASAWELRTRLQAFTWSGAVRPAPAAAVALTPRQDAAPELTGERTGPMGIPPTVDEPAPPLSPDDIGTMMLSQVPSKRRRGDGGRKRALEAAGITLLVLAVCLLLWVLFWGR